VFLPDLQLRLEERRRRRRRTGGGQRHTPLVLEFVRVHHGLVLLGVCSSPERHLRNYYQHLCRVKEQQGQPGERHEEPVFHLLAVAGRNRPDRATV